MVVRVRGYALPHGEYVDLYPDGDRWTTDPVAGAELAGEGWLVPGLVDAHTHPGAEAPGAPLEESVLRKHLHYQFFAGWGHRPGLDKLAETAAAQVGTRQTRGPVRTHRRGAHREPGSWPTTPKGRAQAWGRTGCGMSAGHGGSHRTLRGTPFGDHELQPDVLVGRDEDFTEKYLPVAPVLAVGVFSPSSVINDLNNKKAAYQRLGVQSYWVIDPEEPKLTVFELDDMGVYAKMAEVKGADTFEAQRPFPVRIVPAELADKG